MIAATWLLFVLGLLGATDIVCFHTLSHGIRKHADCRTELLVHSLRGPTYALLFAVVPNFALHGAWFWALCALLLFDLLLSVWDFAIERDSRARLGGLPTGEYELHVAMGMLFGAFVALVLAADGAQAAQATAFVWRPVGPDLLRWSLGAMAVGVLGSGVLDAVAWWRLRGAPSDAAGAATTPVQRAAT